MNILKKDTNNTVKILNLIYDYEEMIKDLKNEIEIFEKLLDPILKQKMKMEYELRQANLKIKELREYNNRYQGGK
jgi:hypothetical protein